MMADLLRLVWLAAIAAVLLRAFGWGRRGVRRDPAARIALVARAVVVIIVSVNVLAALHIYNAATLLGATLAWPVARWLKRAQWAAEPAFRSAFRAAVLDLVSRAERPVRSWPIMRSMRRAGRRLRPALERGRRMLASSSPTDIALFAAAGAATALAVYVRFGSVLGEPRLGNPDLYGVLLKSRQALFDAPPRVVPALSAMAAALSTASAIDALHVIRLAGPTVGLGVVLAASAIVRRISGAIAPAVITLALAAATTPHWTDGDLEVAVLFALLGAVAALHRTCASRPAVAASIAVVMLSAPGISLAGHAIHLVQVAMAVAIGLIFHAASATVRRLAGVTLDRIALPAAVALLLALLPTARGGLFLEYPAAQAEAMQIAASLPRGKWLIVAPVEQLAEAYGRGWYEEQAAFVDRYWARAADPAFSFDFAVDDVLVFVEKRPFKTFAREAAYVPFPTLTDPTYRHYRSLAGRASLQARLFALCASYARSHDGASVYYEDDDLAIYRFRLRA